MGGDSKGLRALIWVSPKGHGHEGSQDQVGGPHVSSLGRVDEIKPTNSAWALLEVANSGSILSMTQGLQ